MQRENVLEGGNIIFWCVPKDVLMQQPVVSFTLSFKRSVSQTPVNKGYYISMFKCQVESFIVTDNSFLNEA